MAEQSRKKRKYIQMKHSYKHEHIWIFMGLFKQIYVAYIFMKHGFLGINVSITIFGIVSLNRLCHYLLFWLPGSWTIRYVPVCLPFINIFLKGSGISTVYKFPSLWILHFSDRPFSPSHVQHHQNMNVTKWYMTFTVWKFFLAKHRRWGPSLIYFT